MAIQLRGRAGFGSKGGYPLVSQCVRRNISDMQKEIMDGSTLQMIISIGVSGLIAHTVRSMKNKPNSNSIILTEATMATTKDKYEQTIASQVGMILAVFWVFFSSLIGTVYTLYLIIQSVKFLLA